jgi:hypothetical protein
MPWKKKTDDQIFLVGILTLLPVLRLITVLIPRRFASARCRVDEWVLRRASFKGERGPSWFTLSLPDTL